jgi:hypothetical protein
MKFSPGCRCCTCVADADHVCLCNCLDPFPKVFHTEDSNGPITLTWDGVNSWRFAYIAHGQTFACQSGSAPCQFFTGDVYVKYRLQLLCSPFTPGWRFEVDYQMTVCSPALGGPGPFGWFYAGHTATVTCDNPPGDGVGPSDTIAFTCSHDLLEFNLPTTFSPTGLATAPVLGGGGYFAVTP